MEVYFFEEAEEEMDVAFRWYENQVVGLGYAFLGFIDDAVAIIKMFPYGCERAQGELRKCLLRRFPYSLIYGVDKGNIVIVAVAHSKKKPGYWQKRMKKF